MSTLRFGVEQSADGGAASLHAVVQHYGRAGRSGRPELGDDDAEGEAADITSWVEANLIGRWYEYTPTSALDIAFDQTSPEEIAPNP
jgi:hypothetical protein